MKWYLEVLKKYVVFDGRAHRTESWMFTLIDTLIAIALTVLDYVLGTGGAFGGGGLLAFAYSLAVALPRLAVGSRRLHDIGRSGWWQLLWFVPIVGWIMLIVWWAQAGEATGNEWGPSLWEGAQPA